MTYSLGIVELNIDALEWVSTADYKQIKKEGVEPADYVAKLKLDVEKNGITKPPVAEWHLKYTPSDSHKFRVKEGNHRCDVAKQLGHKTIKCELRVVTYDNDWIVTGLKHILNR